MNVGGGLLIAERNEADPEIDAGLGNLGEGAGTVSTEPSSQHSDEDGKQAPTSMT